MSVAWIPYASLKACDLLKNIEKHQTSPNGSIVNLAEVGWTDLFENEIYKKEVKEGKDSKKQIK